MKKGIVKWLCMLVLIVQMVFSPFAMAFASDMEDPDAPAGTPDIIMINGPVFEVSPGRENEVEVKLRNVGTGAARSLVVQSTVSTGEENPFSITFKNNSNKVSSLARQAEKTVTLLVDVDKMAASGTYPITLKYTCNNTDGVRSESTDTLYIRLKNAMTASNFKIENFVMEPDVMSVGGSSTVHAAIVNRGALDMYNVLVTVEGTDAAGVSVSGVNAQNFDRIFSGTTQDFQFNLVSNGDMEEGNYPLTFKVQYSDDTGKASEYTQQFFVNVGGSSSGKKPELEIRNMVEPQGEFGVNQNFDITFDLVNTGEAAAENIKITSTAVGEGAVVPKSSSIQTIKELAPGATEHLTFTYAATSQSRSQNYSIGFTVEYDEGGKEPVTFSQYAGANVTNPEGDAEDGDEKTSKPKIIVSKYESDPLIVMAGQEFDLTMTFMNTHSVKTAQNIKMFLTLSEETQADDQKSGNVFTPVDSSNTFYFDSIAPKSTVDKQMRLFVVPDAQSKTYTLTVNFEYEDSEGNEYTATELLGINVKQQAELGLGDIYIPESMEAGMPVSLSFDLYNTGKVTLSNLMVTIEGDVQAQQKSTYLGNLETGNSQYYDGSFTFLTPGTSTVNILVSYDDPSGEHYEVPHEFTVNVMEPVIPEDMGMDGMDPSMMEDTNGGMSTSQKIAIVVGIVVVVIIIIVVVVVKKRKARSEAAFLEADDEEPVNDQDEKGNDVNEKF